MARCSSMRLFGATWSLKQESVSGFPGAVDTVLSEAFVGPAG